MTDLLAATLTIKTLSIWEPWASLVAAGVKRHHTCHWSTAYRGEVAIHAARTLDLAGAPDELCAAALGQWWPKDRPLGCVVAIGRLADCRRAETVASYLTKADREAGNFTHGRYAWAFDQVRRLDRPIPLTGRQGLFNWEPPPDLGAHLGPALNHGGACRRIGWA